MVVGNCKGSLSTACNITGKAMPYTDVSLLTLRNFSALFCRTYAERLLRTPYLSTPAASISVKSGP